MTGPLQDMDKAKAVTSEVLQRPRPFLFGGPERSLFGMLHPAIGDQNARPAVLLCNPLGQESITAHRTFRVFADRLARAGHTTLRFDYYGTGDSGGDDIDVRLSGLCDDVETASRQLELETGQASICLVGLGLGAMVAWLVAARAKRPPARLVLWDPVFDGPAYLEILRKRHAEALVQSLCLPSALVRPAEGVMEALGFALTAQFQADISAVTPERLPSLPDKVAAFVVAPAMEMSESGSVLLPQNAHEFHSIELTHNMDWMNEAIDNGTVVPGAALIRLVDLLRDAA